MTVDLDFFAPAFVRKTWSRLGKRDWLTFTRDGCRIDYEAIANVANPLILEVLDKIAAKPDDNATNIRACLALSKLLANGLRIICPSRDQCEAMEQVDAKITVADYRQPYETVLVDWPTDYGIKYSICHRAANGLMLIADFGGDHVAAVHYIPDRPGIIEEFFVNDANADLSRYTRIAINLNLLLVHSETREIRHPRHEIWEQWLTGDSKKKRAAARDALREEQRHIELTQDIRFGQVVAHRPGNGNVGDGERQYRPHWRRGHFRRQACGARWAERKLIFLAPRLINRDALVNPQETTVTYHM